MSRWFLTSSEAADRAAARICDEAGLAEAGAISIPGVYFLRTYRKRAVSTATNFRIFGENSATFGEDCAWLAGTLLMAEKSNTGSFMGGNALPVCYERFLEGDLSHIQHEAVGHFAIGIKAGSRISICTDALGAFSLYYCTVGKEWFISNSLSLCAEAASREIDSTRFLVHVLQTNLPGEKTFCPGIKRLFGTQRIAIDLQDGNFCVEPIRAQPALNWNLPTIGEALDQYAAEARRVFSHIAAAGSVGLFGTGGLDSRTVLSALLDRGASVRLMYATGNSRLTDFHKRDLSLAQAVAELCGIPFQNLDWSGTQPHSATRLEELFSMYGFQSEIYGSPEGFLDCFSGGLKPYPSIMVGGYSPALTNAKPWERTEDRFSLDALVEDSMEFQGGEVLSSRCIKDKEAYARVVKDDIRSALGINGIDYPEEGASLRTFVNAKLLLHVPASARFLNLINEFGYYIAPFMVKRLYDPLVEMPLKFRKGDEFQLRLIQKFRPELVTLPLYSGIQSATIDPVTLRFVRDTPWLLKRVYRRIKRKYCSAPKPDPHDAAIAREYSRRVMENPFGQQWFSATDDFSPKDLARICQYLAGVAALQPEPLLQSQ